MPRQSAQTHFRLYVLLVLLCGSAIPVYADISRKDARRALQNMLGWALPSDAVRIDSIGSRGSESVGGSAEIQTVFRLRLFEGQWQLTEIRTARDRWERLDVIAHAAGAELPVAECNEQLAVDQRKLSTHLTNKRARCLVANLFGVALPSDDVRVKEVSPFGLSIGSESAALVEAFVRADFRLVRDANRWGVAEFKSGNRDWVKVAGL